MGTLNDRTYEYLGDLGFSGSLNDRMVAYWASEGFSGSFNDKCKAFLKTNGFKSLNKWMEGLDGPAPANPRPSLVGSVYGAGTSISLPEHEAGDLIIITAHRSNNTAPTRPAGWNGPAGAGANYMSAILGWKVAASGSEVSGTWTNAAGLCARVYRNAQTVGAISTANSNSSSVSLPALTLAWDASEVTIDRFAVGGGTPAAFTDPADHTPRLSAISPNSVALWTADGEDYTGASTSNATNAGKRAISIEITGPHIAELTTGTANFGGANQVNGYANGTGVSAFGSIDREPIPNETLIAIWRNAGDSQFVCGFAGDKVALLTGMSVWLDNREFKGSWTYYSTGAGVFGVPVTLMLLSGQADIAQPQTYDLKIAPASP